jgi:Uma2 family endonuclease
LIAVGTRVTSPCEAFGAELKVITAGRVRYPDVSIVCGGSDGDADSMMPTVVLEVLSPSTALTDQRVKAVEYAAMPSILVYCLLEQDQPSITVRRRSANWEVESVDGLEAILALPEVGISVPLGEIYR